jgi:hypothetical protein
MHRFITLISLTSTILCISACLSCSSQQSSPSFVSSRDRGPVNMLCFTSPELHAVRLSAVFPIKPVSPTIMLEEPWAKDFRRYVGQSGNEGGINVTCNQVASRNAGKEKADELRKQGHEVVETNWEYAN